MGGGASVQLVDPKRVSNRCSDAGSGECPVCRLDNKLLKGQCGHGHCRECVDKLSNKCSLCRGPIVDGMTAAQARETLMEALEEAGLVVIA